MKTLLGRNRAAWRAWLAKHHDTSSEIWLVFSTRGAGRAPLTHDDAVEEALCFGWVDSLVKRIDDERYARKFTPRSARSAWSDTNRRRYAKLEAAGLLTASGRNRPPTERTSVASRTSPSEVPDYIQTALRSNPLARIRWESLAPSHRRQYIGWIDSAKREDTRQRRLAESLRLLSKGKALGLK